MANVAKRIDIKAPAMGATKSPQVVLWVRLATTPDAKAPASSWPSIAILITPERSQRSPDIEPKTRGTARSKLPCSIPVNGMNLPAAAQQRNPIISAKLAIPVPSPGPFLTRTRARPMSEPTMARAEKIKQPVRESIIHFSIMTHSLPNVNPNVVLASAWLPNPNAFSSISERIKSTINRRA